MPLDRFRPEDIATVMSWVKTEAQMVAWAGGAFTWPLTEGQFRQHLEAATADPPTLYPFGFYKGNETVGYCELSDHRRRADSAMLSRVIVSPHARGKGYGQRMVREVLAFGFDTLSLNRIGLGVFDFNEPALRCYTKLGFQREGTLRESARVGGRYWNCHIMSLLRRHWQGMQVERPAT
jgi:RimJ/RimL family protein N-acetyltransferase